ncbi:DUF4181 domain-containing protein [Bacillus shivajii]|uniref:DUF4181 domain-containing protein n=1 Tax=Bacillus shivajii TaxID=1983719 RepID=UPI001CFBED92|nr:DUF4181 domain-containing protein [Bacillus shivajii]UCZ54266.1 DUF4181 domain-containing protein [Bacillus shivajii]
MDPLFLSLSILSFIIPILNYLLDKWLVTGDFHKVSETSGDKVERWGKGIIFLMAAVLVIFVIDLKNYEELRMFLIIFIMLGFSFQSFIEWKYLNGTKHVASFILMVVSLVAVLITFHVNYDMALTTFKEATSDIQNMNEEINEITIEHREYDESNLLKKEVTIADKKLIKKFLSESSEMELRKNGHVLSPVQYTIYFFAESDNNRASFNMRTDGFSLFIEHGKRYEVIGENKLKRFIEREIKGWETVHDGNIQEY